MKTLKQLREEKGFTQIQLARILNISYQSYRFYEAGYRVNMKLELEKKISNVLGVEYHYSPIEDNKKTYSKYQSQYKKDNCLKLNEYQRERYKKSKEC